MKNIKYLLISWTFITMLASCGSNSMPDELEKRKEKINKTMDSLAKIRENLKDKDIPILIEQYTALNEEVKNYTIECNRRGIDKNNDETITSINNVIEGLKKRIPVLISYIQAEEFMQNRCNKAGQTLMRSKTVHLNGTKIFMFLTVAKNGYVCVSAVSENALEILSTDCGPAEIKIEEWNAL